MIHFGLLVFFSLCEKKLTQDGKHTSNSSTDPLEQNSHYLPRRLDSLDHGEAHHGPGSQQAHCHLPVESATLSDAVRDVQGLAVPIVGGGRALVTLWHHICERTGVIII